jgi:hypothetical protein
MRNAYSGSTRLLAFPPTIKLSDGGPASRSIPGAMTKKAYSAFADRPLAHLARSLTEGFAFQGENFALHDKPRGEASAHLPPEGRKGAPRQERHSDLPIHLNERLEKKPGRSGCRLRRPPSARSGMTFFARPRTLRRSRTWSSGFCRADWICSARQQAKAVRHQALVSSQDRQARRLPRRPYVQKVTQFAFQLRA